MIPSPRIVRLLRSGAGDPAWNMALDEALLHSSGAVVRFYGWDPPGLSLGYFQRVRDVDVDRARRLGMTVVRRTTGGGTIAHVEEFTFAICDVAGGHFFGTNVRAGYERLHGALARAVAALGGQCRMRGTTAALSDVPAEGWLCFLRSTELDLMARERKLLGSAQRRTTGRVLHHGSLPLRPNPLAGEATCLEELLGRAVTFAEVAAVVGAELEREYQVRLVESEPSVAERAAAGRLAEQKYGIAAWTERR